MHNKIVQCADDNVSKMISMHRETPNVVRPVGGSNEPTMHSCRCVCVLRILRKYTTKTVVEQCCNGEQQSFSVD